MATEKKVYKVINEAGLKALENKCIIVKYAPHNLSAKILEFFNSEFYVLQLCEHEIVLIPFNLMTLNMTLKKEELLVIPYSRIKRIEISEDLLNYIISITTDTDIIRLSTQQKELSNLRTSGSLTSKKAGITLENWHKDNLDITLEALKKIDTNSN